MVYFGLLYRKWEKMKILLLLSLFIGMLFAEHNPTNALVNEDSPYLQQHVHNPVNWYPWGGRSFCKS